jgi:hypothetical protein
MSARLIRSLLIALTILGLLLPRIGAAVTLVAPGVRTIVICTGEGLQTIRIDADGTPVQGVDHADHCVLAHAVDTAVRTEPAPLLAPLVDRVTWASGDLVRARGYHAARPPPRAPPAA